MPSHYDDRNFNYRDYWQGRNYEHSSEILAIRSLLSDRHFHKAADIGGGYGRLVPLLAQFADHVILVEPSVKQCQIAKNFLKDFLTRVNIQTGTAGHTGLPDNSLDLVIMIRVMHHLPQPVNALRELNRILKPGGILVLEFANSHHFKARIGSFLSGQPLLPTPVERRSPANIRRKTISFVNHSPYTVKKQLSKSGFGILKTLSVSNFRSPFLKKILPHRLLVTLESKIQSVLADSNFGPSIFIYARKNTPDSQPA